MLKIHPLTIQVLIALAVVTGAFSSWSLYVLLFVACFALELCVSPRKALKTAVIGLLLTVVVMARLLLHIPGLGRTLYVFFAAVWKIYPACFLIGVLGSYSSSEQLGAYRSIGIPWKIALVLALIYRFCPDFVRLKKEIREGMKLRGLRYSVLHPVHSLELYLVPLLVKALDYGDHISAALVVKGAEYACEKTIYRRHTFRVIDGIVMVAFTVMGGLSIWGM